LARVFGKLFWRAVITMTAVGAVAAGAPAAQAASTPTWKVDKVYPSGEALASLSPVSTQDVWGVGTKQFQLFTTRWNGGAWQSVPFPAGVTSAAARLHSIAIAATSTSNAWVFATTYASSTGKIATVAEHWTGSSWRKDTRFPAGQGISRAIAPSVASVWAFGSSLSGNTAYAERYNGSTWTRASFPALAPFWVSAVSANDIWAISGVAATPKNGISATIEHWNGSAWRLVGLPRLSLPAGPPARIAYPYGIVALGQDNVWAEFGVGVGATNEQQIVLAHLTAHGWSVLTAPSSLSLSASYLIHGIAGNAKTGLWLVAAKLQPALAMYVPVFVHVGSAWRVEAAPSDVLIDSMSAVPGSGDLLAIGQSLSAGNDVMIIGYGI
jgi:hypothetical protein